MAIVSPSILSADFGKLGADCRMVLDAGAQMLHYDVMDGHFVPNLTFGPDFIKAMQRTTDMPLDIHLMVEDPALILGRFDIRKGDIVSSHVELTLDFKELSNKVHEKGGLFGLAVNPETEIEKLETYLPYLDTVTLMLVHPGYAGAKMVDGIMNKVAQTRKYLDNKGYRNILISVDGSVSKERAHAMAEMGADIFVGGTAGIYRKGMDLSQTIPEMREAIDF